jgi:hypothetical protein
MDNPAQAPLATTALLGSRLALRPPPDPRRISAGTGSARTGADPRRTPDQKAAMAPAHSERKAPAPVGPETPAGPPPAFQISLLEKEAGLMQRMARIEAARAHLWQMQTPPGAAGPAGNEPPPDESAGLPPNPIPAPRAVPGGGS